MDTNTLEILEYNWIQIQLAGHCRTEHGKKLALEWTPKSELQWVKRRLQETDEARKLVNQSRGIPIHSLKGIDVMLYQLERGATLQADELEGLSGFAKECSRLKQFMKSVEDIAPNISQWGQSIQALEPLQSEIDRCIHQGKIDSQATPLLSKSVKRENQLEDKVKTRLESYLRNPELKAVFQDAQVTLRNGRYVIPMKNTQWKKIPGAIRDKSASGSTVFLEPEAVRVLQEELDQVRLEGDLERERILAELSSLAADSLGELRINRDAMIRIDFAVATGRLSREMNGTAAKLRADQKICLKNCQHPQLGKQAIPLNYEMPGNTRGFIITGPNTGGKTVVLKTVGLMVLMNQAGLHIPADVGTELGFFESVLADIGDGQSIQQNLSTFSSHMKRISKILSLSKPRTLVLLDEMGSGTDPAEGMALATALLETLYQSGATILATTHFAEIKTFAQGHPGFINGSMAFCLKTLSPQYKLLIGSAGESHGFYIAEKLGVPTSVLQRARQLKSGMGETVPEKPKDFVESVEEIPSLNGELSLETLETKNDQQYLENVLNPPEVARGFRLGDGVWIPFMKQRGIIIEVADRKGEYLLKIQDKKIRLREQRFVLEIPGEELYPENYDMDIVTQTKDYRKKKHQINKGKRDVVLEHPMKGERK